MIASSSRNLPPKPLPTAVFVGAARNCARDLPRALDRWSRLEQAFDAKAFIVAENDSTDGTKDILERWRSADRRRRVVVLDGLDGSGLSRTAKLAALRNRLLDEVAADEEARAADFLVVMDLDDASLWISPGRVTRCMRFEGWDALFANQLFHYADIWALRDDDRSPDDFVRRIEAAPEGWRRRIARLRHMTWRNRPISPLRRPIPVHSAFGAFGIYRMTIALSARYVGEDVGQEICEHVLYHQAMVAKGARLFIHPGLINMGPRFLDRLLVRLRGA